MALAALSGDEQRIIFVQLCNVLEPRVADVDSVSASMVPIRATPTDHK